MTDTNRETPQEGMQVHGSDGERIGQIERLEDEFMLVNKGLLKGETYVPVSIVQRIENGVVVLTMTKDSVEAKEWTQRPEGKTMTVSNSPAEFRTDEITQVSTSAQPGRDAIVDTDTESFADRGDMDTNRRPDDPD